MAGLTMWGQKVAARHAEAALPVNAAVVFARKPFLDYDGAALCWDLEASLRQTDFLFAGHVTTAACVASDPCAADSFRMHRGWPSPSSSHLRLRTRGHRDAPDRGRRRSSSEHCRRRGQAAGCASWHGSRRGLGS